jgi:hypothetical protein
MSQVLNISRLLGFDSGIDEKDFANLGEEDPSKVS